MSIKGQYLLLCCYLLAVPIQVCQIGVVTTPGSSQALCLLGIAQLAQHDDSPASERGQTALADARLSFRASVALEGTPVYGAAPEQLTGRHGDATASLPAPPDLSVESSLLKMTSRCYGTDNFKWQN